MPPSSAAESRARTEAGWLFAAPFRPFFLGASLLAAMSVPLWIWIYLAGPAEVGGMPAATWHAHESVFGYLPAVMAGYLLSATPNWSGRLPASGWPLAGLFGLWVAGRVVPGVAPFPVGLVVDIAFPLAMAAVLVRETKLKPPKQSRHGLMLFPVLAAASAAHRLWSDDYDIAAALARAGVAVAVLLISAVGGRLVPSLTRNALAGRGAERVPEPYGRFDVIVLLIMSAALVAFVLAPLSPTTAVLIAAAGLLQAVRLARWRGWLVRHADVLFLHVGYAWIVVGSTLAVLAADPLSLVMPDAALHAFTAGAIGGMTLAVMARLSATRGVGDRANVAACTAALVAVNTGAALRVAAPLFLDYHTELVVAGGALWSAGFAIFAVAQLLGGRSAPPA